MAIIMKGFFGIFVALLLFLFVSAPAAERLRVMIETDAGGDPDDEQSLVRFLLYANEWDIEGIIANRPEARPGENKNPERTGLGIVRRLVRAYGECWPLLVQHDPRYPKPGWLLERTVSGYEDSDAGVKLIINAVDSVDPRPVWFCNWGTDHGSAPSSLKRALDLVLRERGPDGYAKFKNRLRLSGDDQFGEHTTQIATPFALWVDTLRPPIGGKRWYHRFSALTSSAGGFDLERDIRTGHGPLGALYPTNTTHWGKEGDSMMFIYLLPTGMNNPNEPTWGSWAGRYGLNTNYPGRDYYWANQIDVWNGTTNRDNTLARWAVALQNDFKARLNWCVQKFSQANHPPTVRVAGPQFRVVEPGGMIEVDASGSSDPDGHALRFEWIYYPEPGTYRGEIDLQHANSARAQLHVPKRASDQRQEVRTIHLLIEVTDDGTPALTRYGRIIVAVKP
jgi:hypothetical protein